MSYTNEELETIANLRADFDHFLVREMWSDCEAVIENAGELGYETEVVFMNQALNRERANSPKQEPEDFSNATLETYGD